jgi:hypothetical protein
MRPFLWVPAFEQISKSLHRAHDDILAEPLPEGWIPLIHRLGTKEATGEPSSRRTDEGGVTHSGEEQEMPCTGRAPHGSNQPARCTEPACGLGQLKKES